jgi:hypothetical protein
LGIEKDVSMVSFLVATAQEQCLTATRFIPLPSICALSKYRPWVLGRWGWKDCKALRLLANQREWSSHRMSGMNSQAEISKSWMNDAAGTGGSLVVVILDMLMIYDRVWGK